MIVIIFPILVPRLIWKSFVEMKKKAKQPTGKNPKTEPQNYAM